MSGITDSAKFNNSTSYYVPKVPSPNSGDVITGNLTVTGNLGVGGAFNVDGNITSTDGTVNVNDNLAVNGNVPITGNLSVTGTSLCTGLITATAGLSSAGPLSGSGALISGNLTTNIFQLPFQSGMGTLATPVVVTVAPESTTIFPLSGNKCSVTFTGAGVISGSTLSITSTLLSIIKVSKGYKC